jgi:hypothetical protein
MSQKECEFSAEVKSKCSQFYAYIAKNHWVYKKLFVILLFRINIASFLQLQSTVMRVCFKLSFSDKLQQSFSGFFNFKILHQSVWFVWMMNILIQLFCLLKLASKQKKKNCCENKTVTFILWFCSAPKFSHQQFATTSNCMYALRMISKKSLL